MLTRGVFGQLCDARDVLRERDDEPLSIRQVAKAAAMSPFQFIRRFQALFGEPNANPAGRTFQEAIFKQGIPLAAFEVDDLDKEFKRLKGLGVAFTQEPTRMGPVTIAVCADTCGNLIQLYQPAQASR